MALRASRVLRRPTSVVAGGVAYTPGSKQRFPLPPGGYTCEETRPKLFIPGPIEFSPEVLHAFSRGARAHTDATIIEEFGQSIEMLRECFLTKDAQPFVLSGSGAMGWDAVATNLLMPGERGLVLSSGHFSDRFIDCFVQYKCDITIIDAPRPGARPCNIQVEKALSDAVKEGKPYKIITITGVDTSTAVLADLHKLCEITRAVSPTTLIVVDAVCSAVGEELRMDDWGIDFVHTASQKAIGVPAGLGIMIASQRCMASLPPKDKIPNSFVNLQNWLPIMEAYEARKPSYFATPATNTIGALRVGLDQILATPGGVEGYFKQHRNCADFVRKELAGMGLKLLTESESIASNLLSCVRYPEGMKATEVIPEMKKKGWIVAAGLHPKCANEYFRIGHMAYSTSGRVNYLERLLIDLRSVIGR